MRGANHMTKYKTLGLSEIFFKTSIKLFQRWENGKNRKIGLHLYLWKRKVIIGFTFHFSQYPAIKIKQLIFVGFNCTVIWILLSYASIPKFCCIKFFSSLWFWFLLTWLHNSLQFLRIFLSLIKLCLANYSISHAR